jgi:cysteinyl-tRNA synthetase, unknown class
MKTLYLLLPAILAGCAQNTNDEYANIDFRNEMRSFVTHISEYAKNNVDDFIIIPQNGQELITDSGEGDGIPESAYLQTIDATGRESMFYGYYNDDEETPSAENQHLLDLCLTCVEHNVPVLATDYCFTESKMETSYVLNEQNGFISFAAPDRNLTRIPGYPHTIHNENSNNIISIHDAQNFLYLISSENYSTKQDLINELCETNYDVILLDLYHNEVAYTLAEINQLKLKDNGALRLVICYLSIAEAEDYRYYWQESWNTTKPSWLEGENPDWAGNYKVKYWDSDWQDIIFGNDDSYLKQVIDAGFDGSYLDIIDAFEYFEEL